MKQYKQKLLDNINIDPITLCWNWTRALRNGYGAININKKSYGTHRLSYSIHNNISLDSIRSLLVCHKCDNPRCINPNHLFLGTHKDNAKDAFDKGRMFPLSNGKPFAIGHNPVNSKLTFEMVIEIKDLLKNNISTKEISKKTGISLHIVNDIKRERSYKNIN